MALAEPWGARVQVRDQWCTSRAVLHQNRKRIGPTPRTGRERFTDQMTEKAVTPVAREILPTYLSLEQAAEITDQSVKTLRRRISDGSLPAYRFGPRHIRIKLEDLQALARRIPAAHRPR